MNEKQIAKLSKAVEDALISHGGVSNPENETAILDAFLTLENRFMLSAIFAVNGVMPGRCDVNYIDSEEGVAKRTVEYIEKLRGVLEALELSEEIVATLTEQLQKSIEKKTEGVFQLKDSVLETKFSLERKELATLVSGKIGGDEIKRLSSLGMIPKRKLSDGVVYDGINADSHDAVWNESLGVFQYVKEGFESDDIEECIAYHPEDSDKSNDCRIFIPLKVQI